MLIEFDHLLHVDINNDHIAIKFRNCDDNTLEVFIDQNTTKSNNLITNPGLKNNIFSNHLLSN